MNVLAFDIESIPDVVGGRRIYNLEGLADADIAQVMFNKRRERTDSEFLPVHLQRIVAISAVLRSGDSLKIWSLGDIDAQEPEIIRRFFDGVDRYTPTLVTWNGNGFDLPVLHHRAMVHLIQAPRYWDNGDNDRDFRFNNYLSRYHYRHTDLMDVLNAYQPRGAASLDQMAQLCGLPGKLGMDGSKVWEAYQNGELKQIRDYCETDALNTYLLYLRWQVLRGVMSAKQLEAEHERVEQLLKKEQQSHFTAFLAAWHEAGEG